MGSERERNKRLAFPMVDTKQLRLLKEKERKDLSTRLRNTRFEKKSLLELHDILNTTQEGKMIHFFTLSSEKSDSSRTFMCVQYGYIFYCSVLGLD